MESTASAPRSVRILVWDLPVRLFHWASVACVALAWLTAESERWRGVHVLAGYTFFGLLVFRLVWGGIGSRYARFASFWPQPAALKRYLQQLWAGRPEHHVGHNPAGALAIFLMLGLGMLLTLSGMATHWDWLEDGEVLHEPVAFLFSAVVIVHVLGVIVSSFLHRENLVRAMFDGHKYGPAEAGLVNGKKRVAGVVLLALLGFWAYRWQTMPAPTHSARHEVAEDADDADEEAALAGQIPVRERRE